MLLIKKIKNNIKIQKIIFIVCLILLVIPPLVGAFCATTPSNAEVGDFFGTRRAIFFFMSLAFMANYWFLYIPSIFLLIFSFTMLKINKAFTKKIKILIIVVFFLCVGIFLYIFSKDFIPFETMPQDNLF